MLCLKTGDRVRIDLNKGTANILISKAELGERRAALQKRGGYAFPKSQTPWQEIQRSMVDQLDGGMVLKPAVKYQKVAQLLECRGTITDAVSVPGARRREVPLCRPRDPGFYFRSKRPGSRICGAPLTRCTACRTQGYGATGSANPPLSSALRTVPSFFASLRNSVIAASACGLPFCVEIAMPICWNWPSVMREPGTCFT